MIRTLFILSLLLAVALLAAALPARAQTALSIVDVLPPYRLSATLLANGHFSISTLYTDSVKTLVYQEDGTGNRPVNYTSHIHFKVDDVIFQLPFELNPVTRESPPEHALKMDGLFRDTLGGAPRVNARMYGMMPDGDTVRFIFTMQPVQRPSGGFIRMSAEVWNTTRRQRSIGVLMLIDTKIGDNDRAPIISSFGYRNRETEFDRSVAPGMPEFWLGLEGTPTAPGLTARGNLRASGLIEPDYFLFGNWKDNTAVPGATGLDLAQWRERRAFDADYTDSAILLVWDEENMPAGARAIRASTEIGIVDSLHVGFGQGGFGGVALGGAGGGGGGGTGGGGCLGFDTLMQASCDDPDYHPYLPNSLQTLYLVTNTGTQQLANVHIAVPALPAGLTMTQRFSDVIPTTLDAGVTGVATLTFRALPRLTPKTYSIPVALVANAADTLIRDTLCISVAGLQARIMADSLEFLPLCPSLADTLPVRIRLKGTRCLDLEPRAVLAGSSPAIDRFTILDPAPGRIPANGEAEIMVRYQAGPPGDTDRVSIIVMATERGLNDDDRDTTIIISDTVEIRGISRDAEFVFAGPPDTLNMGAVCLGDTSARDWLVTNIGGCELSIDGDYTFLNDPLGQFSVVNTADFPLAVARGTDERIIVRFTPKSPGIAEARLVIHSIAAPFADTLLVRGRGDSPAFTLETPSNVPDTLCPEERFAVAIPITNPTACEVVITGVASSNPLFNVDKDGFVIPPLSTRQIFVTALIGVPGAYTAQITVTSAEAGQQSMTLGTVVASRTLAFPASVALGDVRLGESSAPQRVTITSDGTAEAVITGIRIAGANSAEYMLALPNGETFPLHLPPGGTLDMDITFTPADLESRRAAIIIQTAPGGFCGRMAPLELEGRGVMPVIDAPRRRFDLGRICAGRATDTVIMLRNPGNAPLTVHEVQVQNVQGRMRVETSGLPVTIQPDSSRPVAVRLEPELLGQLESALRFTSDGMWFTAPDTVVRITATGVICGTIWADTVQALVGDRVSIPIHLDASPLTPAQVARLMNESGTRSISLTLAGDVKMMRFDAVQSDKGMMAGLASPPVPAVTGANARITSGNTAEDLAASDLVTTLAADVLLGNADRATLKLGVETFADGNADLAVRNGLLLAEYCAIDRRYVQITGPLLRAATTPMKTDGEIIMHLPDDAGTATLTLYDPLGRAIAVLRQGGASAGTYRLSLAGRAVAAGIYTAVLSTDRGSASTQLVVAD